MILKIVVLSDMHIGSSYGICPRSYFNEFTNSYQLWVINQWENFIEKYKYPDYLVLNGDIIDGPAKKDPTKLCIPDTDEQVNSAVELISPLIGKNTEILGVSGSGYHTGKGSGFDGDRQVTEKLISTFGIKGNHQKTENNLSLSKYGMSNIAFHHKGKNEKLETVVAIKRAYKTNAPKIGVIVASHLHRRREYYDGVKIYHTPCWEWETDFMDFVEPVDIGSFVLYVDVEQKSITPEYHCVDVPTEVYEEMQHWNSISSEREKQLKKIEKEKEDLEIKKLSKEFSKIKKEDLTKIVHKVKEQIAEENKSKIEYISKIELPKPISGLKKKEDKKEINWPKLPV